MLDVALFRAHPSLHEALRRALVREPVHLHDVCTTERLAGLVEMSPNGEVRIGLKIDGLPIGMFSKIIYTGMPRIVGTATMPESARKFSEVEWFSYLTSCLRLRNEAVLGLAPPDIGNLPYGRYRSGALLREAGWIVEDQEATFSNSGRTDSPKRHDDEVFSILFSPKRWIIPDDKWVTFEDHLGLEHLAWRTWELLLPYRAAFSSLQFCSRNDEFIAKGIQNHLSGGIDDDAAASLAADLLY